MRSMLPEPSDRDNAQADIKKQKAAVRDHAAAVTAQQRALQTARLEFGV